MVQTSDVFLLTNRWFDDESGESTTLEFWWHSPEGIIRQQLLQQAVCFIESADQPAAEQMLKTLGWPVQIRPLALSTFAGKPVSACYLPGGFLQRWRALLAEQQIVLREADVRLGDRYLMERFVYGAARLQWDGAVQVSAAAGFADCQQGRLSPGSYRPQLRWLSLDIETSIPRLGEEIRLYSVGLVSADRRLVLVVDEHDADTATRADIVHLACEADALQRLNQELALIDPDVIIGWNLVQFDIEVLVRKYRQHRIAMSWGRDGEALRCWQRRDLPGRIQIAMNGRLALDGIELLRAASYQFESFALDDVARELLSDGKLITGHERGSGIEQAYQKNLLAFADYNLQDCDLVWRIFERTRLLEFAIERSLMTGLPLDRMGGSVAAFENLYLPRLHRAGRVAPNLGEGYQAEKSPGGYVMDSRPGLFEHVLVLDFKSLYPSIIRTFCIDPLGLVEGLAEDSADQRVPGFFGGQFHKHRHLLPDLIRQLGERRDQAKREGNKPLSQAIKIIMASCYGVLGSEGCRFHDTRLSASITKRGHQIILESSSWIREQGYEVIYGDTDSVFVLVGRAVSDNEADQIGLTLMQGLNQWWQQRLQSEFGINSCLEMEYETHYRRFFMPAIRGADTGSKKRYAGLISAANGEPQMVFKGLEAVRSDWTPLARQFQQELYRRIFLAEPWQEWLQQQVQNLLQGRLDHLLVYRKRLRRPLADYQRQIPPHARAAGRLDQWRQLQGLPPRYQQQGGWICYRMAAGGPEPLVDEESGCPPFPLSAPDYSHYLDKQLRPVAEAIFQFTGDDPERWLQGQGSLF
ncbi:DNA polymerase II [Parathalassolituus penaei]|uniref:DNA polymerase n=1 Tax=Parathalassolituus penaei TaxID=2997323 RepID=A0A9X3EBB0_9GAMM|nr:DNA polymerase II [Parathalassolituus penaei]MCY0964383.1 DNA polymerase II [Parathalassolituus penaei]